MTVSEALKAYGPHLTAIMMFKALTDLIDDEGKLMVEGKVADHMSLVAVAMEETGGDDVVL